MALDERLRRELDGAGRPADPTGVYEELIRRRERRRMVRKVQQATLAIVVVTSTVGGALVVSRMFQQGEDQAAPGAARNGLIAYAEIEQVERQDGIPSMRSTIWVMNQDGSERRELLSAPGSISGLAWSPDGRRLAFDADGAVQAVNADGTELIRLTDAQVFASMPTWSPDGTEIAFGLDDLDDGGGTEVAVMNADGSNVRLLTSLGEAGWPDWSPDGEQIAFIGRGPDGNRQGWDIYVMNADGSGIQNLTDSPTVDLDPQWSPDGTRILFRSRRDIVRPGPSDQPDEVYVMNADGSNPIRLTNDANIDQSPVWSPDGRFIAFSSIDEEAVRTSLVLMNADGSERRIAVPDLPSITVAWQPVQVDDGEPPAPPTDPSLLPSPTSPPEDPRITDVGLGLRLCDVSSVRGTFLAEYPDSKAFVGAEPTSSGRCRSTDHMSGVIAIDLSGDNIADIASEPFACQMQCGAFAAPDVDGDGTDELLAVNVGFSVVGLNLFDVVVNEDAPAIVSVMVEPPGDAALGFQGFDGSGPPQLWIGGDGFGADALRCDTVDGRRVLVSSTAQMVPPDSPDAVWEVHETTFVLEDGVLRVIGARDYEAADPSVFNGTGGCGARMAWP